MDFRIDKIPVLEAGFKKTLTDANGKKFQIVKSVLNDVVSIRSKEQNYYYPSVVPKKQIVYHFTAGVLTGDISALTTNHVSVPYVVARDGTIYELYDPKFWAYHLGMASTFNNKERSSASLGIEISNIGPLTLKDDVLYDIYNKAYCKISDTAHYNQVAFRGYQYFASYTEEQYIALKSLTKQLVDKFKVNYTFLPEDQRFEFLKSVPATGIVSHANYRSDKYDLAPNFDFSKVAP